MKGELLELAGEKGFKSEVELTKIPDFYATYEEINEFKSLARYIWLCELQEWLMRTHKIDVLVVTKHRSNVRVKYGWIVEWFNRSHHVRSSPIELGYTKTEAIEEGCIEALKLIKALKAIE